MYIWSTKGFRANQYFGALLLVLLVPFSAIAGKATTAGDRFVAELEAEIEAISQGVPSGDDGDIEWVKAKLGAMVEVDNRLRGVYSSEGYRAVPAGERAAVTEALSDMTLRMDRVHTKAVKKFLKKHEWFKKSVFGAHADANGWLLVQHANHDTKFQSDVLDVLKELVPLDETRPVNFAYLSDRLAITEGRGQLFGTQGRCVGPGVWGPLDIQDPDNVDARRIPYKMVPLAEYVEEASAMCP